MGYPLGTDGVAPAPQPGASVAPLSPQGDENVAMRVFAPFILTVHAPVPVQRMPQPLNVEPALADAASESVWPFATVAWQPDAAQLDQLTPLTVPVPVPPNVRLSV